MAGAPLAYLAAAVVAFELLTAIFTGINQSCSFSVPQSNLAALTGKQCAMADKVWVETDPNRDMLTPVDATLENPLGGSPARPGADANHGFSPDGVPDELYSVTSSGSLGARRQRHGRTRRAAIQSGRYGRRVLDTPRRQRQPCRAAVRLDPPPPRCWAATRNRPRPGATHHRLVRAARELARPSPADDVGGRQFDTPR